MRSSPRWCPRPFRWPCLLRVLLLLAPRAWAKDPAPADTRAALPRTTQVQDARAREQLLGPHGLTLQWIVTHGQYDVPGKAAVTERQGLLTLEGEQQGDKGARLQVSGVIERVDEKSFVLVGHVETRVDFVNAGQPCTREGRFTFRISGKRHYWRMQEMKNPCSDVTDYVDVYLR